MRKIIVGVSFVAAVGMASCGSSQPSVVAVIVSQSAQQSASEPAVIWQGDRPTCPDGYQPAASEEEYRSGHGEPHCAR